MKAAGETSAERTIGAIMVTASAVVFGLAGAMTKLIEADVLTITCWRGLVGGLLITLYVLWRRSSDGGNFALGWRGWLLAAVGAAASVAFLSAFKFGFVANAAIIYATIPFAAASLAWLLLGERFRLQTLVAAGVSLAGVAIMVAAGLAGGNWLGDALALLMTCLSALYIVLIRRFRDTPVVWAGAVSAFMLFALGWLVTDPLAVTARDMVLLVGFGASFAVASVLWTEGARLIPSAEAGLLGSAEVPAAIFFAWLFLSELPPMATVAGGLIVLAAVFAHAFLDWRAAARMRAQAPTVVGPLA